MNRLVQRSASTSKCLQQSVAEHAVGTQSDGVFGLPGFDSHLAHKLALQDGCNDPWYHRDTQTPPQKGLLRGAPAQRSRGCLRSHIFVGHQPEISSPFPNRPRRRYAARRFSRAFAICACLIAINRCSSLLLLKSSRMSTFTPPGDGVSNIRCSL
jgi:hypothetical protein